MKRFSKILTLLLAIAAIVTAFTVVALAEEETALTPVTTGTIDFESKSKDEVIVDGEWGGQTKLGIWYIGVADNGNKYVISSYADATGTNGDNYDVYAPSSASYHIGNYPTFAFDFDVMSTTGTYNWSCTLRTDLYGGSSNTRLYQMGSVKFNSDGISLPNVADVWNHVTVIVNYAGNGVFNLHYYVNGSETLTRTVDYSSDSAWLALFDESGNFLYENIRVHVISIYPPYGDSTSGGQICYDNMSFTYYPADYSITDVASYIYNDTYDMPYGQTRATLNGVVYDDVAEAVENAIDGDTVILKDDATDIVIDKAITLDANIYGEDGVATGAYYNVSWSSTKGYGAAFENGKYNFISAEDNTEYDIEVISDGLSSYYKDSDFYRAITTAPAGATVKLHGDVDTDCGNVPITADLTIDLNGYDIRRVFETGIKYEATYDETAGYTYGTDTEIERVNLDTTTTANQIKSTGLSFFSVTTAGTDLTITSSRDGSEIYAVVMNTNTWYYNDVKLDHSVTTFRTSNLVCLSGNITTSLDLSNVTIYSTMLLAQTGTSANVTVNIDNIKHFAMHPTAGDTNIYYYTNTFSFVNKLNVNFNASNSLFYNKVSNTLVRSYSGSTSERTILITFTNCDIIKNDDSYVTSLTSSSSAGYHAQIFFNDCRILDTSAGTGYAYVGPGTYASRMDYSANDTVCPAAIEGYELVSISSRTVYYTVPTKTNFLLDTSAGVPTPSFSYETKSLALSFNTVVSKPVSVTWMKDDAVYETETLYPGADDFSGPFIREILENDSYRDIAYQWINADGKLSDAEICWDDVQTYYAAKEVNGEVKYVAGLKDAMLNLSYYGHFAYNLYAPVVDGVTITKLGDYNPHIVKVDGKEYYTAVAGWMNPKDALTEVTNTIKYEIDGVEYTATFKFNALTYVETLLLLPEDSVSDIERDAALKLVAYLEEVGEYVYVPTNDEDGNEIAFADSENGVKFSTFFTDYNGGERPTYITDYANETVHTIDETFSSTVKATINFAIHTNNRMTLLVTLSKETVDAGYTLGLSGIGNFSGTVTNSDGSVTYYTNNTDLVNAIMASEYEISVYDKDKNAVASTKYNLATYCAEVKSDLMNSFYTFGKAAVAVRDYLDSL